MTQPCIRCKKRLPVILASTCFRCTTAEEIELIKQRWEKLTDVEKARLQQEHWWAQDKWDRAIVR